MFWYRYEVSHVQSHLVRCHWSALSGSAAERPHWRLTGKKCAEQAYLRDIAGSVPDHHNKASDIFLFVCSPVPMKVMFTLYCSLLSAMGFPCDSAGKESVCNVGDLSSIPGLGRSPGEGKGYPLQSSGLENSLDRIVHSVAKSWTRLSDIHFHIH